eukprot:TRINITY_DN3978_c1_g1_i1.p1 TRINITY_DN3978_c1_g1~~TRINITY_DN3978_c1_g1_i1.p1  ORF type:complete len:154 (-),score=23.99 TRINITY_DN3978_c1_g1_i1:482-943(-)
MSEPESKSKEGESEYSGKKKLCAVIAKPLAEYKLYKKIAKLVKKSSEKKLVRRGVKEVTKCIRKKIQGIVILAGNISPIDVLSHLPILCENNNYPYVYVPSKEDLGGAAKTKRSVSAMLLLRKNPKATEQEDEDYLSLYDEVKKKINAAQPVW